jgi:hypothetical protein
LLLCRPVYWVINHITEYGLSTSAQKTKLKAFKGRDPDRTRTVIDNKIIEQVNLFNYLGNISYEGELDIDNKLNNFLKITGILNVFRLQRTPRKTRIKLCNTLAPPILLYGRGHQKNNSSRDEIHEMNSRIHLDRLRKKCPHYSGVKNNTNFGQINGIKEKLDATYK